MLDMLNKFAQISNLTYFPPSEINTIALKFGFFTNVLVKGQDVIIIGDSNECNLIAIRGSDKIDDWYDNLKISGRKISDDKLEVHLGFQQRANYILEKIMTYIDNMDNKEIVVCGHSLGGALAFLIGNEISKKRPNQSVKIITYGCPMIGKGNWYQYITNAEYERNLTIFHVLSNFDPIIYLPSKLWGWKRPGIEIFLDKFSYIRLIKTIFNLFTNRFNDHEMDNYCKLIKLLNR